MNGEHSYKQYVYCITRHKKMSTERFRSNCDCFPFLAKWVICIKGRGLLGPYTYMII